MLAPLPHLLVALVALTLPQSTPTGGAIGRLVPPVPTPASFVSDERGVLTAAERAMLDERIRGIQRDGLGDVGVAIIPSIGDYAASQVGVEIYRTWRVGRVDSIGSARRNLGVLLLIVPKEISPNNRGECWITTGTGAEAYITDATAGTICRSTIIPRLRNREYAAAIAGGLVVIENRLRGAPELTAPAQRADPAARAERSTRRKTIALAVAGGIAALIASLVAFARWRRHRARRCPKCGRMMQRLSETADDARLDEGQRLEEKLKSVDYDVWTCRCGESKLIPYRSWFNKHTECRECHRRTAVSTYVVLVPATTASSGVAEKRFTCKFCSAKWTERVILPRIQHSSSSGGRGGGGGGGGSSFGGSGSTSGGGGGGSY